MQKRLIVLIPVYRPELEPLEVLSLTSIRKYCHAYPLYFLAPEGLRITHPSAQGIPYLYLPKEYFDGFAGYNRLMMSTLLYERIAEYEFCLIAQLDVLLFHDKIEQFLDLPIDYIGALVEHVWEEFSDQKPLDFNLNGGASMRRVSAFLDFLHRHPDEVKKWTGNEDVFFTHMAIRYPQELRIGSREECLRFSRTFFLRKYDMEAKGRTPFAVHGIAAYDPCFLRDFSKRLKIDWADDSALQAACNDQQRQMDAFQAFLREGGPLFLYGAGVWGEVAAIYLKQLDIPIEAFVVSDGQSAHNPSKILGIPVKTVSDILRIGGSIRVLFCISLRYNERKMSDILSESFRGADNIELFLMDYRLYNYMGESIWLARHEGTVHGDET